MNPGGKILAADFGLGKPLTHSPMGGKIRATDLKLGNQTSTSTIQRILKRKRCLGYNDTQQHTNFGSSHLHPNLIENIIHCTALLIRMALAPLSGYSSSDVDMRTSAKRGFLDVETDPGVLSSLIEQLNKTAETVSKLDTKLDAKLDSKFEGWERRMEQMIGIQTRC